MAGRQAAAVSARILERAEAAMDGCWNWPYVNENGYGRMWVGSRSDGTRRLVGAHVAAFEAFVGPVPVGLELDHLCRNRACVNPEHLDLVTHRENMLRGETVAAQRASQTHCKRGHAFTPGNTYVNRGKRYCRTCRRASSHRYTNRYS